MALSSNRWHTIAESQFPWERDALDYLRERLPDQGLFRAWSNFEFIAEDVSIYEVDLVVLTAAGFLLVEWWRRVAVSPTRPTRWKRSEATNEVESLPLEPARTDVVRVMNLHKAKGLEAALVFLADPAGGVMSRVDVHIERTELKARGWFKVVRKSETSYAETLLGEHVDWSNHQAAEIPYLEAEEDRLRYVAATRAREMLVISRWSGNQRYKPWGVLNDHLAAAKELRVPSIGLPAGVPPLDCSVNAQTSAAAAHVVANDSVREPSWSITSVTAEAHHIARMTRTADAEPDDATKVVGTDTPAHRADAGIAWGTLMHALLEHAMRHKTATRDDLRRLAMWLTVDEPQLRTAIEEALDTVERAAHADFWQIAKATEHSVESPFVASESGRLTTGVIDLLFQSDAGWQVVDYKRT